MTLQEAIARQEGINNPNSRASLNKNPGNIEYGTFARLHGATGTDGRFAIFPNLQTGYNALTELLKIHYTGLTIAEAIAKYAPSNENDTQTYIRNVCEWLTADNPIDGYLG
jgi:hypothetical protein